MCCIILLYETQRQLVCHTTTVVEDLYLFFYFCFTCFMYNNHIIISLYTVMITTLVTIGTLRYTVLHILHNDVDSQNIHDRV